MKCFIPNHNLLTWTKNTVEWLHKHNIDPVILDNASTYPPLQEWYLSKPCKVIMLTQNHGNRVPWITHYAQEETEPFFVTDPDLSYDGIPDDFIAKLQLMLHLISDSKAGFSLCVDDIPEPNASLKWMGRCPIKQWETQVIGQGIGPHVSNLGRISSIDTTFALYRTPSDKFRINGARLNPPYSARHLPWYLDYSHLDDEYTYYLKHADPRVCNSLVLADQVKHEVAS